MVVSGLCLHLKKKAPKSQQLGLNVHIACIGLKITQLSEGLRAKGKRFVS